MQMERLVRKDKSIATQAHQGDAAGARGNVAGLPGQKGLSFSCSLAKSKQLAMLSTVTAKGQVTLPKELRDRLGIVPGTPALAVPASRLAAIAIQSLFVRVISSAESLDRQSRAGSLRLAQAGKHLLAGGCAADHLLFHWLARHPRVPGSVLSVSAAQHGRRSSVAMGNTRALWPQLWRGRLPAHQRELVCDVSR